MGGQGSGWQRGRKTTVDEGLILGIKDLAAIGVLNPGCPKGTLRWRFGETTIAAIEYNSSLHSDGTGTLWLRYTADGERMYYTVTLVSTVPHYGGRRWWFICPIKKIRVAKLYLPPDATKFASRQAHGLTYRSCQSSFRLQRARRQTERLARQMAQNEAKFDALLKRGNPAQNSHAAGASMCSDGERGSSQ
jgi:hypothetical protein